MPDSSSSTCVLLPFGSLMGAIPVDSVRTRRGHGEFSKVLGGSEPRLSEVQQKFHSVIDPGLQALRRHQPAE